MSKFNRALPKFKGKTEKRKITRNNLCSHNPCNVNFNLSLHYCILLRDRWGWRTEICVFSKHLRPKRQMVLAVSGLQGWLLWEETGGCPCVRQLQNWAAAGESWARGDTGVSSVTTCEREGKKHCTAAVRDRSGTNVTKTQWSSWRNGTSWKGFPLEQFLVVLGKVFYLPLLLTVNKLN